MSDTITLGRRSAPHIPWYLAAIVLAAAVLAVYWQVGGHDFINIDDDTYVYDNPIVRRGLTLEGISWALTTFHASNWHPLTWLSHMFDVTLFGVSAGWHHRMNLLYHLLNTELLFLVLWRMSGGLWQSAFAAALFGVHPLHVESVAWIAERKDVLSTLFWMLSLGAYLYYTRRPGTGRYIILMALFALGLMCKPMLVTLPFVLLLLDWWPLRRLHSPDSNQLSLISLSIPALSRLIREKIPLFGLSAMSCVITYIAQAKGGAVVEIMEIPFVSRISNALVSYVVYLWKTLYPSSLAVYYPHPATFHSSIPAWQGAGAFLLLAGLSAIALWQGLRRPYLTVGWLWYLGTLIPVIGLVQVGAQASADRYTYVPLIGIFIVISWGMPAMLSRRRHGCYALGTFAGLSLAALVITSWLLTAHWRNSITLLTRAVLVTEKNWFALNNLGVAYNKLGMYRKAIDSFHGALRIYPDYAEALNNLGRSHNAIGMPREAIVYLQAALRLQPDNQKTWNNLGVSYGNLGQHRQASEFFRKSLQFKPDFEDALNNLGLSHSRLDQNQEAISFFKEALRLNTDNAEAWNNLGSSHNRLGQHQQAIGCFKESLRINPNNAMVWNNLGVSYGRIGMYRQAIYCFGEALRIHPDFAEALNNLEESYNRLGR